MSAVDDLARVVALTPDREQPFLVAVDGVDGSGKTTFSRRLADAYEHLGRPALVVHLDDFLNPRQRRYRQGRDSPVGFFEDTYNLDAFDRSVLAPLRAPSPAIVRRGFDYRQDRERHDPLVAVPGRAVVVVDGMFLHRDELVGRWDLSIFLEVPFAVSVARMAARDGTHPDPDHPSNARYVDGQKLYLSRCSPQTRATLVIDNA